MEAEPHDPERRSLVTPGRSQRKEKSVQGRARSRRRSRSRSRSRSRRRSRSCRRDCSRNISHSRHGSRRRSCNRGRSPSINFENSHNSARSQSRYCDLYIQERHLYNERKRIRELEDELQKKLRDLDSDKIQPLQNKSNKRQHEESVPQTPLEVSPKHVSIKTTPNDKYKVMIRINGNSICCQVDLGSEVTLIRESDAKAIKLTWTSVNSPYLRGLGNIPYLPLGRTFADIELQGLVEKQVEILIVADSLINLPVLLGHSFTERPNLRIIKTDTYLQFDRVDDTLNSKISLRSGVNLKIGLGEMRVLIVKSDEVYNGYVYIRGNIRGCPGNEHYCLCEDLQCTSECKGASCVSKCTGGKCLSFCAGSECKSLSEGNRSVSRCYGSLCKAQVEGDRSYAKCKGPDCEAGCAGQDCRATCDGDGCTATCNGEDCPNKKPSVPEPPSVSELPSLPEAPKKPQELNKNIKTDTSQPPKTNAPPTNKKSKEGPEAGEK
ncbi:unnamed protein product, partial [Brenthis ino]